MKSVNIKGKEYITVNERLIYFRSKPVFKGWKIIEELVSLDEKEGIFKVTIMNSERHQVVNAHAQEYRDSSYINKTSFLENGFTSALGRALGYLGIGIDTAIASAEEVETAIINQEKDNRPWLKENELIATLKGAKKQGENVIKDYRMKKEYREKINNQFNLK
jgi:hypothetical protein|tara:strand:- start:407 stop:895 length:489 start_codon:yes stop_codon:yes gene_type:complete